MLSNVAARTGYSSTERMRKHVAILLSLVYVVFPFTSLMLYLTGTNSVPRQWLDIAVIAWCLFFLCYHGVFPDRNVTLVLLGLFCPLVLAKCCFGVLDQGFTPMACLLEIKFPVYFVLGGLIACRVVRAGGSSTPWRSLFGMMGGILGGMIVVEVVVRSAIQGEIIRPKMSGEVNYDAALILAAWICVKDRKGLRIYKALMIAGVVFSQSRTNLAALLAIETLGLIRFPLPLRNVPVLIMGFAGVIYVLMIRFNTELGVEGVDRYHMWMVFSSLPDHSLWRAFWGRPVFSPLPITYGAVPAQIAELWDMQAESTGVSGVFPYHLHAFFIRALAGWGGGVCLVGSTCCAMLYRNQSLRARVYWGCFISMLGLTMGVFYLTNVAVPLLLAAAVVGLKCHKARVARTVRDEKATTLRKVGRGIRYRGLRQRRISVAKRRMPDGIPSRGGRFG